LTSEYLRGRRVHFTRPLRLYVISSVLFFLVLATFRGIDADAIHLGGQEQESSATQGDGSDTPATKSEETGAPEGTSDEAPSETSPSTEAPAAAAESGESAQ